MDVTISFNEKELQTFGTGSLIGTLDANLFEHIKRVRVVFLQSSLAWRQNNGGPNSWVIPEYAFPCFLEDVLKLQNMGIEVLIETQVKDPT